MVTAADAVGDGFTTTVSSKGQIVIPKAVREHLGLQTGDVLAVEVTDDAVLLRVVREDAAAQRIRLFGAPVPLEGIATRFAGRVPTHLRGLAASDLRKQAESAFARQWRENERAAIADADDETSE